MEIKVKLAAIAKDESAYIPQWIFHHLFFGFDCIEIWLNGTTDNSIDLMETICKTVDLGKVSYIIADDLLNECKKNGLHFQREVYQKIFDNMQYGSDFTHLFFLDLDEYWTPADFSSSIKKAIMEYDEFDALSFQWLLDSPDIKREDFQRPFLSVNNGQKNRHLKTLIKLSNKKTRVDIHNSLINNGIYKLCDGLTFTAGNIDEQHLVNAVDISYFEKTKNTIDIYFIYHQIYRSQREYLAHLYQGNRHTKENLIFKNNRWGYLPDIGSSQNIFFGIKNDVLFNYNNLYYEFISHNRMLDDLNVGRLFVISRFHDVVTALSRDKSNLIQCKEQLNGVKLNDLIDKEHHIENLKYHFDSVYLKKNNTIIEVMGWVFDPFSSNSVTLKVQSSLKKDLNVNVLRCSRGDVVNVHYDANLECGFKFELSVAELRNTLAVENIEPFYLFANDYRLLFPSDKLPSKIIIETLDELS
jgi:hypothetical protein